MSTKYERIQAVTASRQVKQGIFLYAPLATHEKAGIVKPAEAEFEIGENGLLNIKFGDQVIYPHVLSNLPEDLTDFPVNSVLFITNPDGSLTIFQVVARGEDKVLSDAFVIDSSLIKETFSPTNYTPATPTAKGHFVGIDNELDDIITGGQVVGRAVMDEAGNNIRENYGASLYTDNDDVALKIAIRNKLNAVLTTLILREATTTKNGLMSSADKVKLQALPTNANLDIALAGKVPSTRKILGIDLANDVLLDEFKTALGEAIEGVSGLMSATDKARLDALHALLGVEADADAVVNTINEVLAIFNQYQEGADLVSALGGKVDKVAGKGLSKNDFTDALKARLDSLLNGSQYYNKEYIDALKDLNGWSSALLTPTALTNGQTIALATLQQYDIIKLFARNTSTNEIDTDSFDTSVGLGSNYKYIFFDNAGISFTIGGTDCVFATTAGYELKIIGQKYVAQDAENVEYGESNVKDALDGLLVPDFVDVVQSDLISEITATDDVEIIDDAGMLIKVEGNEPTNLVSNSDLLIPKASPNENEPLGFSYSNATDITLVNGIAKFTATAKNGRLENNFATFAMNDKYYAFVRFKAQNNLVSFRMTDGSHVGDLILAHIGDNNMHLYSGIYNQRINANIYVRVVDINDSPNFTPIEVDYIGAYNITDMINKGIKNDSGVSFADLSDAEIKEQMDIWMTNGFPTVINKLVSKSDNLFDSEFYDVTDLESENLIANSDLLIPKASPNENQPLGFSYSNATDITLVNGIAKFTATAKNGRLENNFATFAMNDKYYAFVRFKAQNNLVSFRMTDGSHVGDLILAHIGDNNMHLYSGIYNQRINANIYVRVVDINDSPNFTPIEVDYIGAINITDLVSRGILPSGLTDAQYKTILDSACNRSHTPMVNVPLRETSLISVEPSVAYRLIKASENSATHKVIEYTADNQVVKVNSVDYSGNAKISAPITMNALTTKIKLVSDLMNRPTQLLTNPNFDNGTTGWYIEKSSIAVTNGILTITPLGTHDYAGFGQYIQWSAGEEFYNKVRIRATTPNINSFGFSILTDANRNYIPTIFNPVQNQWYEVSAIYTPNVKGTQLKINFAKKTTITNAEFVNERVEVDYRMAYNITDFKNAGVVNDTGTLFSRLTNDEIKEQMDIWVQNGFPDQVIHALYPNGVDSAIAIKYNDADAVFRPQQIDELPLNLTLRSGEYWQDGYIVKQNGNAEYYPLSNTFSAWNYGQVQAIYDSGIPADFTLRFASNVAGQVKTTQEYLVEARERLDTLRRNQELLIEKLGVDIEADDYDSFVGITSAEYEYFALEGIKEGDELNIDAYGQGVLNLLPNTITATQTAFGLTVAYDNTTGIVTVNGTSTGAGNIILKTGMTLGKPQGTTVQLMRYFVSGTADLNGSYIGYILAGTSVSNRINENSESLYDPYINASGELKASGALSGVAGTSGQTILFQVFASGMVFTDFKFKLGVFEGLTLQPFVMPSSSNSTAVDVYNKTANKLNTAFTTTTTSGITVTYDALSQEYIFDGTASGANSIILSTNLFSVSSGDRLSIKRLYQSGDITPVSALPIITLISGSTTIVSNSIYKMTAPEGQTPTPDVTFNTGTASDDLTNVTLKLTFASGDVFTSYRCRIMIHNKSSDIGYAPYSSTKIGSISLEAGARGELSFTAIEFGILSFVPQTDKLNVVFGTSLTDLSKTNLEYNAGIQSPNRRISELNERLTNVDNVFRDKVIAIWGDSRESNNPTSDPQGVGDQKDTSYPAILAKKLGATVLNFGLSGGCWAENTVQQDASSAIVNRVNSQDVGASADVIIISSMNDFKLATPLGSPLPNNKTASTFYGAMRLTYDRLGTKYPGKKIWLVLPQKRYDETTNYGGGSYLAYRKAQIEVAREYGIPTIDLYNNFPNADGTAFETTNMLNPTHFSAIGNDMVAELIARALLGNGNGGSVDVIPTIPTAEGTYTLKVVISAQGIPTFSWVLDE